MQRHLTFGLTTGLCAALLFMAAASASNETRALVYAFLPLPIIVAGLAAGWQAAAIASIVAAATLTTVVGPAAAIAIALTHLAPASFVTYLVGLHRDVQVAPSPTNNTIATTTSGQEWYPIGRVILWIIAIAVVIASILVAPMYADLDQLKVLMRENLDTFINSGLPAGTTNDDLTAQQRENIVQTMIHLLPSGFVIVISLVMLLNLWLAGHITRAAHLSNRPWPDLAAITYPPGTALALAACIIAATLVPGLGGTALSAACGGLFFAFVLLGLAIIHHVTRNSQWRSFILFSVYVACVALNSAFWILLAIIALAEPISPLRRDFINADTTTNNRK